MTLSRAQLDADRFWQRPCAAPGLISYRYPSAYNGWIMIGALDVWNALVQANRSITPSSVGKATFARLQVWNGSEYVQCADPRPGLYYVSAQSSDGKSWWAMLGPFDAHQTALDLVDTVRTMACELDPRGVWMSYGTVRVEPSASPLVGKLNSYFGM